MLIFQRVCWHGNNCLGSLEARRWSGEEQTGIVQHKATGATLQMAFNLGGCGVDERDKTLATMPLHVRAVWVFSVHQKERSNVFLQLCARNHEAGMPVAVQRPICSRTQNKTNAQNQLHFWAVRRLKATCLLNKQLSLHTYKSEPSAASRRCGTPGGHSAAAIFTESLMRRRCCWRRVACLFVCDSSTCGIAMQNLITSACS